MKKYLNSRYTKYHYPYQNLSLVGDIDYGSHSGRVDPTMRYAQVGVAHEMGHTLGNTRHSLDSTHSTYPMHGEEYRGLDMLRYLDDASIMSIGNTVRQRHFDYLKIQLQSLINQEVEIYLF